MYRPKHDGQPDGLTDDGYDRPAHSLIERLESQLGRFHQTGAMGRTNQIIEAAVVGPEACDSNSQIGLMVAHYFYFCQLLMIEVVSR